MLSVHEVSKKTIVTRDPSHCLDLGAKTLSAVPIVAAILEDAKTVIKLVKNDRVHGIRDKLISHGAIGPCPPPVIHPETRMYLAEETLRSAIGQRHFLAILGASPEYQTFHASRPNAGTIHFKIFYLFKHELTVLMLCTNIVFFSLAARASLDASLATATLTNFSKWVRLTTVFGPLRFAVKLTSSNSSPMSAFFPIVVALKNDLETSLADAGFDADIGEGASAALMAAIRPRFNTSGTRPAGTQAVGFLDKYQLWTTALDPHSRGLNIPYDTLVEGGMGSIITDFCKWASPGDDQLSCDKRRQIQLEFMAFQTATGSFAQKFDISPPHPPGHKLTLKEVSDYIVRTGGHESRLAWWNIYASSSLLFTEGARTLLSIRITGSMTVERVAKPLKNKVMTKERAKLSSEKGSMLLRVGLNLRFLQAFKDRLWDSDDEEEEGEE
jgi:hypothetical protein